MIQIFINLKSRIIALDVQRGTNEWSGASNKGWGAVVNRTVYIPSRVIQMQNSKYFLAGQIQHVQEELAHSFQFATLQVINTFREEKFNTSMHWFIHSFIHFLNMKGLPLAGL